MFRIFIKKMSKNGLFNRMNRYKAHINTIVMVFVILCSAMVFTGCSEMQMSVQDLLSPPKLSVQMEEIKSVIKSVYKEDVEYIHPQYGDNLDSIQFIDLDNDGVDEVLLFNKVANSEEPLRALLLIKQDDTWTVNNDIKGVGFDINIVKYQDIDNDGMKEIFIGWQGGNSANKVLSAYQYENGSINKVFEQIYSEFCIGDLTGDGNEEIVLIDYDRNEGMTSATMYDSAFTLINEVIMEGFVKEHFNIQMGYAKENQLGCFIDVTSINGFSWTELLVYNEQLGKMINVFSESDIYQNEKTFKHKKRISKDVDLDAVIEIAKLRRPFGYDDSVKDDDIPWITSWYNWDGDNGLIFSSESYCNSDLSFEFLFTKQWKQNITIEIDKENANEVILSYVDAYSHKKMPMIKFIVFSRSGYDESNGVNIPDGAFEITRNIDYVYYAKKLYDGDNKNIDIDVDDIKNNFNIIDRLNRDII